MSNARATGIALPGAVRRMRRLPGRLDAADQAERLAETGDRIDRLLGRQRVDHVPAASDPDSAEPVEVARHGRLGDVDVLGGQELDELPLGRDLTAIEDRGEYLMARGALRMTIQHYA